VTRFAEHSNDIVLTVSVSLSEINLYYLLYFIHLVWCNDSIQIMPMLQQH